MHVLTKVPLAELESVLTGFVEELGVDQVNLTQAGLRGLCRHTGAVLHDDACVRVSVHTEAFQKRDALTRLLAEAVAAVLADVHDDGGAVLGHSGSLSTPLASKSTRSCRRRNTAG